MVGNVDVFLGGQPRIERHCGDFHACTPGKPNLAQLRIGSSTQDEYLLQVAECPPGWSTELVRGEWGRPIQAAGCWVQIEISPSAKADTGRIVINVVRTSDWKTVPVEFSCETTRRGRRTVFQARP